MFAKGRIHMSLLSFYVLSDQYYKVAPIALWWTTWTLLRTTRCVVQEETRQHGTERAGFQKG